MMIHYPGHHGNLTHSPNNPYIVCTVYSLLSYIYSFVNIIQTFVYRICTDCPLLIWRIDCAAFAELEQVLSNICFMIHPFDCDPSI